VSSAELYRLDSYRYGRFKARIRYAPGEGVVSSFFLWKDGSEVSGTFWNELDFEKLNGDCRMQTNTLYGTPVTSKEQVHRMPADMCDAYHDYRFEWTPTSIAWFIDETEIRRETGAAAAAFADNAQAGMQMRFNVWPGDASFGGNFDPAILPVRQYISWVEYSSYQNGNFTVEWREEFNGSTLPAGWGTANWASPKQLSTHSAQNVSFVNGIAVLSLTSDQATGFTGTPPPDGSAGGPSGGRSGMGGTSPGGMGGTSPGGMGGAVAGGGTGGAVAGSGAGGAVAGSGAGGTVPGGGTAGMVSGGGTAPGGTGGTAAAGSGPAAGTNNAGTTAQGGNGIPANGGSAVTASGGQGNGSPGGGAAGTGAAGANSAGSAGAGVESDDAGCGCVLADSRRSGLSGVSAALLALLVLRRRRNW
jgi:hypothetical protein